MKTFHKPIPMLSLFALLLVALWACRKEKPGFDLSDKDPCSCASEVSAEFVIEELGITAPEPRWIETDTVLKFKTVRFTAKEENAISYKWYVGSEILSGRSVNRTFGEQWSEIDIPITLVITKQPNLVCFPDDDGYDSLVKSFYISKYPIWNEDETELLSGPTLGTYRMISPEHADSFDITIRIFKHPIHATSIYVAIYNWDGLGNDCISYNKSSFGNAYRWQGFQEMGGYPCGSLTGYVHRPMTGPAEFVMRTLYLNGQLEIVEKQYHYKGRKL
jgi:hypothetical protein